MLAPLTCQAWLFGAPVSRLAGQGASQRGLEPLNPRCGNIVSHRTRRPHYRIRPGNSLKLRDPARTLAPPSFMVLAGLANPCKYRDFLEPVRGGTGSSPLCSGDGCTMEIVDEKARPVTGSCLDPPRRYISRRSTAPPCSCHQIPSRLSHLSSLIPHLSSLISHPI